MFSKNLREIMKLKSNQRKALPFTRKNSYTLLYRMQSGSYQNFILMDMPEYSSYSIALTLYLTQS